MKIISACLSINNNGINQSIITRKSHRNTKFYRNDNQAAGDMNRNATIAQLKHQRDACEKELYRLRYGIENLLSNNGHGDFNIQPRQRMINPFQTMKSKIFNLSNTFRRISRMFYEKQKRKKTILIYSILDRQNTNWLDRCSPCCRRWRRNRLDDNVIIPNAYNDRRFYSDRTYDTSSYRTPRSSFYRSDMKIL